MRGGERFAVQIRNPIAELVVTLRDNAVPFTVKGVANRKVGVSAVAIMGEV